MYWISIIRGAPPLKMVMGSIPAGDAPIAAKIWLQGRGVYIDKYRAPYIAGFSQSKHHHSTLFF